MQPPVITQVRTTCKDTRLVSITYLCGVSMHALYDNLYNLIHDHAVRLRLCDVHMRSHHHHIYHNTRSFAKKSCLESCSDCEFNPVSVLSVSWSQVRWVENSDTYVECEYAKLHLAFPPEMHVGKWFHRLETYIKANNWKATTQALKLSGLCRTFIEQNVYRRQWYL